MQRIGRSLLYGENERCPDVQDSSKPKHGLFDEEMDLDELRDDEDKGSKEEPRGLAQQQHPSHAVDPPTALGVVELERRMTSGTSAGPGMTAAKPSKFGG